MPSRRSFLWVAVVVLVAAVGGLWAGWHYVSGTPEYSLYLFVRSIQDKDRATAERFINRDKVAESVVEQVMQKAITGKSRSTSALGFAQLMRPALVNTVRDTLGAGLQTVIDEDVFKELRGSRIRTFLAVRRGVQVEYMGQSARVTFPLRDGTPTQVMMAQQPDRTWQVVSVDPESFKKHLPEKSR